MTLEKDESLLNREKKIEKLQLALSEVEDVILKSKGKRDNLIKQIEKLKKQARKSNRIKRKSYLKTLKYLILLIILVSITVLELYYFNTIVPFSDLDILLMYYPWIIPIILILIVIIGLIVSFLYLFLFNAISKRIKKD